MQAITSTRRRSARRAVAFGCGVLLSLATACASSEIEERRVAKAAQALETSAPTPADHASDPPLAIEWEETAPSARVRVLAVRLSNSSATSAEVELELLGSGFDGRVIARPYGRRSVPARSSVVLTIRPDELPVQTVGASSMFTIVARHALPVPARLPDVFAPGAAARGRQVSAPPRRVTFDADYAMVTLRTNAAQAEASAPKYDDDLGAAAAPAGRVFDSQRGGIRDIAELAAAARRPGAQPVAIMGEPVELPHEGGPLSAPAEVVP